MLKLLKYDFRRNLTYFIILISVLLGCFLLLPFLFKLFFSIDAPDGFEILKGFLVFAVVIVIIVALVLFLCRVFSIFNSTLFGRESYLTLTLPYSIHKIIIAKCLSVLLWIILFSFFIFIGTLLMTIEYQLLFSSSVSIKEFFDFSDFSFAEIITLINSFVMIIQLIFIVLFGNAVVNTKLVKKHEKGWKVLIILGCLFISLLVQMLILQLLGDAEQYANIYYMLNMYPTILSSIISLLFLIGSSIGLYFWIVHIISKKIEIQ